jgi:hypothetical protein
MDAVIRYLPGQAEGSKGNGKHGYPPGWYVAIGNTLIIGPFDSLEEAQGVVNGEASVEQAD